MAGHLDFETLVQQHQAALFRFALSLTRNESDACDLVQETFYIWAAKGHQLGDVSKAKGWLFTTLHREFLASRRRLVRFPHHELDAMEAELPQVPPALADGVDAETLLDCLARTDEVFRGPVALFYLEDYSYPEIAEILGVPLGTVKSRIARGMLQLQKMLREAPPSPVRPTLPAVQSPSASSPLPSPSPATPPAREPSAPLNRLPS